MWPKLVAILAGAVLVADGTLASERPEIDQVAWMAGDRLHTAGNQTVHETWIGPAGGMLLGMTLTASGDGRPAAFEYARIAADGAGELVFYAQPSGGPTVAFPISSWDGNRVVFENPQHDFPQRVIYWNKGGGVVGARIEGVIGGEARSIEWEYR